MVGYCDIIKMSRDPVKRAEIEREGDQEVEWILGKIKLVQI